MRKQRSIFSILASTLFTISILLAMGAFGYKFFLNQRIKAMGQELEAARAELDPEAVKELIRLNSRLVTTEQLVNEHFIISPIFDFLEASTPANVRYTSFSFDIDETGVVLNLRGEARGYASLAAASDLFTQSPHFHKTLFSEIALDQKGNVGFSLQTEIEPTLISYNRFIGDLGAVPNRTVSTSTFPGGAGPVATSTTPRATPGN